MSDDVRHTRNEAKKRIIIITAFIRCGPSAWKIDGLFCCFCKKSFFHEMIEKEMFVQWIVMRINSYINFRLASLAF